MISPTTTTTVQTTYLAWQEQESYVSLLAWEDTATEDQIEEEEAKSRTLWAAYKTARAAHTEALMLILV